MCCLYCGKEIGAFRLLRDSEFCSVLHRQKYGERLGRALHDIAAPAAAPAGIAGFRVQMPFQQGNQASTLNLWQPGRKRVRLRPHWPLTIDTSDDTNQAAAEPAPVPESPRVECPPQCERWVPAPAPEPVAAIVQASAAPTPAYAWMVARFAVALEPAALVDVARHAPAACELWMPAPESEPVTAFVQPSIAQDPAYTGSTSRFAAALEPAALVGVARHAPALCETWMPAPEPEPVSAFVRASAAAAPAQTFRTSLFGFESAAFAAGLRHAPAPCDNWMPAPAPEPVAAFVTACAALAPAHALRLPLFAIEAETASPLDSMLDLPPVCERWMPSPAPAPVAAFVQAAARMTPAPATFGLRMVAERAPASLEMRTLPHANSGCRVLR